MKKKRIISKKRIGGPKSLCSEVTFSDGTKEYRFKKV